MRGAEWKQFKKGDIFNGKVVPSETWFCVLRDAGLIVGTVCRAADERWVIAYLTHEQTRVVLYQSSSLTLTEALQRWEYEFTEYVRANPRNR